MNAEALRLAIEIRDMYKDIARMLSIGRDAEAMPLIAEALTRTQKMWHTLWPIREDIKPQHSRNST